MKEIEIDEKIYKQLEKSANILHMEVEEYIETLLKNYLLQLKNTTNKGTENE